MGAALKLLIHGPALLYVVLFAVLSAGAADLHPLRAATSPFSNIYCLALFSYIICAFVVKGPWEDVGWAIVGRRFPLISAYLMAVTRSARHHDQSLSVFLADRKGSGGREGAQPDIIIMDEATSGWDAVGQDAMMELFRSELGHVTLTSVGHRVELEGVPRPQADAASYCDQSGDGCRRDHPSRSTPREPGAPRFATSSIAYLATPIRS